MTREELKAKIDLFTDRPKNVSDVILYVPSERHAIVFEEGGGAQLLPEDYKEGIDNYIMATFVSLDSWDGMIGEILDDGEQYPLFYSSEEVKDEFDIIYDLLESFYLYKSEVPDVIILQVKRG